ncbi:hypothetical protein GH714_040847 [Hevea brasiliensis]|uniref:DUF538 family protein n=1 Tax=Hevea brasiliensis TaxID=3981 RepID=A0A6A6MQA0_HEVBR|nr:hypothetical protein GH714_040847 [Hevea brasiliensis]
MEKALTKVERFWISKKAKEEFSTISRDLSTLSDAVEEKAKWVFNKLKGKSQKSLADVLREYNLSPGLSSESEMLRDSSILRYATRVKGTLSRGRLTGIEGMKTKVLAWVKVTSVTVESYKSDKILFTFGVKKSRPKDAYELPREAIQVEEF